MIFVSNKHLILQVTIFSLIIFIAILFLYLLIVIF